MGIEKIISPIKAESPDQHREILEKKLMDIQVLFAARKHSEPENSKEPFTEILKEHTLLIRRLGVGFADNASISPKDPLVKEFLTPIIDKINILAKSEDEERYNKISDILSDEYKKLEENNKNQTHKKLEDIGLIKFDQFQEDPEEPIFEKYGFNKGDDFLEIHIKENYQSSEKFGFEETKKEFSKLAETIIDRFPQDRAVVGASWLMSHPLAQKLGFKITNKEMDIGMASWFQFIDKDGQINVKKVEESLETGEKPFKAVWGYIPTEEFLERYLPQERKGNITLKIINPEKQKESEKLDLELNELREKLRYSLTQNALDEDILKNLPVLTSVLNKLDLEKDAIKLFAEISKEKISLTEAQNNPNFKERLSVIGERIKEYKNIDKYIDKVVEIK